MKKIALTQGRHTLVDDEDYKILKKDKWHYFKNAAGNEYAVKSRRPSEGGGSIYMHRVIMNPSGSMDVDHQDGDGLNNQKYNLRICSRSGNLANRKLMNHSSTYKGVSWYKPTKKWRSQIKVNGNKIHLGYFNSEIDAGGAYDDAAIKYHGEFARTNRRRGDGRQGS